MLSQSLRRSVPILSRRVVNQPSSHSFSTTPTSSGGGSSLGQRLVSFSAGLGIGFGMSFYVIWEELSSSNARFTKSFDKIDARIKALEGSR